MSITRLPNNRWRAQVYDPRTGKNVSVARTLGLPTAASSFKSKTEAKRAREKARELLGGGRDSVTVAAFRDRWLSDPVFARPKQSTMLHNTERTRAFAARYGSLPIRSVGDEIVSEWLQQAGRHSSVPALRAMFNDAAKAKAGRLVTANPFLGLGLEKSRGNRDIDPPAEEMVWALIRKARELSGPSFSAWLQVAAHTGMRPGELDALRWDAVDFERGRVVVREQFNAKTRTFTPFKNSRHPAFPGGRRDAILTPPAREALLALPREAEWCFPTFRGTHWRPSTRAYHWNAVRAGAGYTGTLYLATRHYAGAYMTNVLLQPSEDVAIALGHTDGGDLVRRLYGHRDREQAMQRVANAYADRGNVRPLGRRKETA